MDKNELAASLRTLGFTDNLISVYFAVLKIGKSRAARLLSETGLQRSVVYASLHTLVERKLISKTLSKGVALFSANDPRTLIDEARDRTKLAESVAEGLALFQGISAREAVVYEGADIIQRVADKSLSSESGSTVYFLGASKFGSQLNLERYWKRYHTRRVGLDISCKILYDKDTPQEIVANRNVIGLCEAKYMPFGLDLPMWLVIFEDHVAMVVPGEEPPLAFVVKSQKTADGFRKYFEYLWKQ